MSVVCTTGHGQPGQDSCPVDPGIRLWQLAGKGGAAADDSEDEYDDWMEHDEEANVQIFIARILVSNIMYNNVHFCGILCDIVLFCLILLNIFGVLQN